MGWQERVEKYQAEQQQRQAEVAKLEAGAREVKRQHILEKLPPLFAALEKLGCQELLTQMRDEVWKLGEVSVLPKLDEVTAETPVEAEVCLEANWPYYRKGYNKTYHQDITDWVPPAVETRFCSLSVVAKYDDGDIFVGVKGMNKPIFFKAFNARESNARPLLERRLVEDILERQKQCIDSKYGKPWAVIPYDRQKELAEPRVIQAIIEEGLKPPAGFEYLLELAEAEKAHRLENNKAQPQTPELPQTPAKRGCLKKFFGGR